MICGNTKLAKYNISGEMFTLECYANTHYALYLNRSDNKLCAVGYNMEGGMPCVFVNLTDERFRFDGTLHVSIPLDSSISSIEQLNAKIKTYLIFR